VTIGQALWRGAALVVGAVLVVTLAARGLDSVPDLLSVVVAVIALREGVWGGALAGLTAGWVLDLLPPGAPVLGLSALAYAVAGAVVGRFARIGPVSPLVVSAQALLACLVVDACTLVATLARGGALAPAGLAGRWLVTATVALLLGPALVRLDTRTARIAP
jgi:rod shape-determining protein MreD